MAGSRKGQRSGTSGWIVGGQSWVRGCVPPVRKQGWWEERREVRVVAHLSCRAEVLGLFPKGSREPTWFFSRQGKTMLRFVLLKDHSGCRVEGWEVVGGWREEGREREWWVRAQRPQQACWPLPNSRNNALLPQRGLKPGARSQSLSQERQDTTPEPNALSQRRPPHSPIKPITNSASSSLSARKPLL